MFTGDGYPVRIGSKEYFEYFDLLFDLFDENTFKELYAGLASADPLGIVGSEPYTRRLKKPERKPS